jgi:hypothetical protein
LQLLQNETCNSSQKTPTTDDNADQHRLLIVAVELDYLSGLNFLWLHGSFQVLVGWQHGLWIIFWQINVHNGGHLASHYDPDGTW